MKVEDVIRAVMGGVAPPRTIRPWSAPGSFAAACRFCGDDVDVVIVQDQSGVRVAVDHAMPLCAEFVQYAENLP